MKRLRLFANRDRVTRTRIAYIALTAGTVVSEDVGETFRGVKIR